MKTETEVKWNAGDSATLDSILKRAGYGSLRPFIIKAVNSHDALMEALDYIGNAPIDGQDFLDEIRSVAREAIAKVKKA